LSHDVSPGCVSTNSITELGGGAPTRGHYQWSIPGFISTVTAGARLLARPLLRLRLLRGAASCRIVIKRAAAALLRSASPSLATWKAWGAERSGRTQRQSVCTLPVLPPPCDHYNHLMRFADLRIHNRLNCFSVSLNVWQRKTQRHQSNHEEVFRQFVVDNTIISGDRSVDDRL